MKIIEISNAASADYRLMEQLVIASFPSDEYRELGELREFTESNPLFHPGAIYESDEFQGLLNYWDFGSWRYIEHFATEASKRNGGLGARALSLFFAMSDKPVVIEVEEPGDEMARRRIGFYERNGFVLLPDMYIQPAYKSGSQPVRMRIMARGNAPQFSEIESTLHNKVYGVE